MNLILTHVRETGFKHGLRIQDALLDELEKLIRDLSGVSCHGVTIPFLLRTLHLVSKLLLADLPDVAEENPAMTASLRVEGVDCAFEAPVVQELASASHSLGVILARGNPLGSMGLADQEVALLDVCHGLILTHSEETLHRCN